MGSLHKEIFFVCVWKLCWCYVQNNRSSPCQNHGLHNERAQFLVISMSEQSLERFKAVQMPLYISGVSDLVSGVLRRRQRFDPQMPMSCGLPSKTSFCRGLQTVIETLCFSNWPHAHGILYSKRTAHAWYTIPCTNSPLRTLEKQKQALKHMAVLQGSFFASLTALPKSSFLEM